LACGSRVSPHQKAGGSDHVTPPRQRRVKKLAHRISKLADVFHIFVISEGYNKSECNSPVIWHNISPVLNVLGRYETAQYRNSEQAE